MPMSLRAMISPGGDALPLTVLTVTTFFPNGADPQRAVFVQNLVRAMRRRCSIEVIAPVPLVPVPGRNAKPFAVAASETGPDGVHVIHPRFLHLPGIGWLSGLSYCLCIWRILRRRRTPGGAFIVHAHCAYPDGVGVALAARLLGMRYVVTAHGSDINVYAQRPLLRFQIRWALRHAAGVIAVSGALRDKIAALVQRPVNELACIACAAVDPAVFFPGAREQACSGLPIGRSARLVVFVGQLVPIKGLETLLGAWISLYEKAVLGPTDRLVMIGAGPQQAALQRRAAENGLGEFVHFTGALAQSEVALWIRAAHLLCLPSLNEGTPNVVVEALACGVPVVASDVGGIAALLRQGDTGLLVPPNDVPALAEALRTALARKWDAEVIAASVADRTWQAVADRNLEFFDSVMGNHVSIR